MKSKTKGRILIVDDERSMREMLEIFLGREGYDLSLIHISEPTRPY